jgi:hypothetical protein
VTRAVDTRQIGGDSAAVASCARVVAERFDAAARLVLGAVTLLRVPEQEHGAAAVTATLAR